MSHTLKDKRFDLFCAGTIEITTTILSAAAGFETSLKDTVIARGKVRVLDEMSDIPLKQPPLRSTAKLSLDKDDIYAEMKNRCVGVSEKMKKISKLDIHPQGRYNRQESKRLLTLVKDT